MEEFCIELAGVPAQIRCRFSENRKFLNDYLTNKEPLVFVEPTYEDCERMQIEFDMMDDKDGFPRHRREDSFLEQNAIHKLLTEEMTQYGVLLMHGSALCMDGEAYIFTAPSGTGKSTHARLWREVFRDRVWMINDDKPMLRVTDNGVTVWGTPWDGKHHLSKNASAPLKAIIRLERGDTNHIEPMSKADAFPLLLKKTFVPEDPALAQRVMESERKLLDAVDFYTLGCNTDPDAARIAWEGMNTGEQK